MFYQKTRVMATNMLSFLNQVDEILYLQDGAIVDHGKYQELLSNSGPFSLFLQTYLDDKDANIENISINHRAT